MSIITTVVCDKCKITIPRSNANINTLSLKEQNKKYEIHWHLCDSCYTLIENFILGVGK